MKIQKVGVAGCGLMGAGIAQVCAQAGFEVAILETEQRFLDKGTGRFSGFGRTREPLDRGFAVRCFVTPPLRGP